MKQTPKQRYNNKLKTDMNHHDPDLGEMAAKQVCKLILDDSLDLQAPQNSDLAKSVTSQFLKQVGSDNFQVHSNAIRCLAQILPKFSKQQMVNVFKTTIGSIVNPKTQSKRKQVFSSSAGQMIQRAPWDIGINLASLYVQCVNQFLNLSSRKNSKQQQQVLLHLLTIIINFSSKWPDVVGNKQVKYDREKLISVLLKYIQTNTKLQLVLKCMTALQKIAVVFNQKNFQFTLVTKQIGLLNFINKNIQFSTNQQRLKSLKVGVSCLDHLLHAHNRQMKFWVNDITNMCVKIVNDYKNQKIDADSNKDILVTVTQIIQSAIHCLTGLLKSYSSQLTKWIGNGQFAYLSSFIQDTLNYDLQRMMNYFSTSTQDEQGYQDDDYYFTQDSVCWKVREVTLAYLTVFMRRDIQFKNKKLKQPAFMTLLSNKLIEQNENVSKKAFECFNYIIQSISTTKSQKQHQQDLVVKRVKSTQRNFALDLVEAISNKIAILFSHKKTKQQTKTQASKTLLSIIELLHQQIRDNQVICSKILNLIQQLLEKVKPDSCINLIKSSKTLINGIYPYSKTQKMIGVYIRMTKNTNFKIVAASFDGLRNALLNYHQDILKTGKINQILSCVLSKLKQHDADKLVKIQAIRCLGPLFLYLLVNLPPNRQQQVLQAAQSKLKVQIDKTTILSQISKIPLTYKPSKEQKQTLKNMLKISSQNIGSTNYDINTLSIQSCDKLIRLLGKQLDNSLIDQILKKCRPLILNQKKVPKFMDAIIVNFPNSMKPVAEDIIKIGQSSYNLKMIEMKIISADDCIKILKTIATSENLKNLSLFLSKINPNIKSLLSSVNDSKWGLVNLGALGYIGNEDIINEIKKIMANSQNHQLKLQGAKAIGNIASRFPRYSTQLIKLSRQQNQGYLYLQALKQMLSCSQKSFPELPSIISFLFQKAQQSDKQTNKHTLSQCIGYVPRINSDQFSKILNSIDKMTPSKKFVVASSLRYALQSYKQSSMEDQKTDQFLKCVIKLTMDKDVNVQQGAMKSLNSVVGYLLDKIRNLIDNAFMTTLLDSMSIKAALIKIIDYGFSKQKKDLGRGLRIQAFNFLKAIIGVRQIESYYNSIIMKCLQKINEESSNDLILKRVHIIRLICEKDFTLFTPYQNQLSTKIGVNQGILKSYANSATSQDERIQGYLKGLIKQILIINSLNKQGSQSIKSLVNSMNNYERLKKVIGCLEKS